jgi:hypothetical protein
MERSKLWARHGEAVRQAIELGELVHLETASEELPDEFLPISALLWYAALSICGPSGPCRFTPV